MLQELPEDLSDLRHRAERIAREHADTHASLVNLGKQIDLGKGSRTRAAGVLVLSLPWVILPITAWVIQDRLEVAHVLAAYATLYCLAIPFGIWRRASLTATGINRRMLANLVAILSLQGLIVVLAATAGMPLPATLLILLVSAVGAGNSLAMLIDRRLWPVVPAGVVAVTLGTLSPRHLFLAIALSNAAAVGSMVASWAGGSPKSAPTDSP